MITEPLPIDIFVNIRFQDTAVLQIIEDWRIDPDFVKKVAIAKFKEIGIYSVNPGSESLAIKNLIFFITHSPEILKKLKAAEKAEARRKQSRISEG